MTPQRILLIGCGGAGKSTLAREMGRRTNLPVVHLDRLYWRPGWVKTEATEWNRVLEEALSADQWIMDGNYGGTLPLRFQACDAVVFLDLPRWLCFGRVLKRRVAAFWRTRQDAAVGCPDRLTWQFLVWDLGLPSSAPARDSGKTFTAQVVQADIYFAINCRGAAVSEYAAASAFQRCCLISNFEVQH